MSGFARESGRAANDNGRPRSAISDIGPAIHLVDAAGHRHSPNGALWNIASGSASLRLDVEGPDDVAPLLRFVGDELAEVGGRTDEGCATQIGKLRLDFRVGERGVDLLVELVDDLGWRLLRCVGTPYQVLASYPVEF